MKQQTSIKFSTRAIHTRWFFFAHEKTGFCKRQCQNGCIKDCVGFELDMTYTARGSHEPFLHVKRHSSCTCCCLNRPVLEVTDSTTGQALGSIRNPFRCCNLVFNMRDLNEQDVLVAEGGCCQWGLLCPLPCGPCSEVRFPIRDAQTGAPVAEIQKKVPSCLKFMFASDVDNYKIEFGNVQNPQYKALVMAMALFIDFRYFNVSDEQQQN
mmetsp:Transcript_47876/g.126900  ORF Transcript_47876/g.126900 Transcript_47876/m.126900 type:complete len:210 (-) Transcript_47876:21-650(-)